MVVIVLWKFTGVPPILIFADGKGSLLTNFGPIVNRSSIPIMLNWYNLRRSRLWRFATQYHYSQMLIVRTNGIGSGDITQLPTI